MGERVWVRESVGEREGGRSVWERICVGESVGESVYGREKECGG